MRIVGGDVVRTRILLAFFVLVASLLGTTLNARATKTCLDLGVDVWGKTVASVPSWACVPCMNSWCLPIPYTPTQYAASQQASVQVSL